MSHIVEIKTQVTDAAAITAACQRLQLPTPTHGTAKLFTSQATGVIVTLPNWRYPVVFNTTTGEAKFDNYGGRWGDQAQLDRLLQLYAVEKAKSEARKRGYSVTEQALASGQIKLSIHGVTAS